MMKPAKLPPAQERFCQEYLVDLSATRAYAAAYPRAKATTAEANGSRMLGNAKVSRRIQQLKDARSARLQVKSDDVVQELALIAFSDIGDYSLDEGGAVKVRPGVDPRAIRVVARAKARLRRMKGEVEEVTTELQLWDKLEALRLLGQHLGLFKERVEITAAAGVLMMPAPITPAAWAQMVEAQRLELAKPYVPPAPR